MAASKDCINVRILANEFEKKWDLHKGIYSLCASRETGLVFKGSRTEATINRQIIRQHGIGKLKGVQDQHFYFIQVGRKSPYGEGTINIFDTPELARLGKKKNMSGAAYIGEWITNRVYSTKSHPAQEEEPEVEEPRSFDPREDFIASGNTDGGVKWWQKESEATEYELDIDIPLQIVEGKVVVEDTEDIYSMVPSKTERSPTSPSSSAPEQLYYNVDATETIPSPVQPKLKKGPSKKEKKKQTDKVMVEDTQDLYSLPAPVKGKKSGRKESGQLGE